MNAKIVVLMACYNGEDWIEAQVESILSGTLVSDIFISVDPSTDSTAFICQKISEIEKRVTLLPFAGKFGGAAQNFFRLFRDVDLSVYDYVSLSDQDDVWFNNKLERSVTKINTTNCDAYSSNVLAFWDDGKTRLIDKAHPQVKWDFMFESAGPGCTFVFKKHIALKLQSFLRLNKLQLHDIYLHDWFFYAFTRSSGSTWYIDKEPTMNYRQHGSNQVGVNLGTRAFLHRYDFVISGKAFRQTLLIAKLCGLEEVLFVRELRKNSKLGLLKLALNSHMFRRKRTEKIVFFILCIILFFKKLLHNKCNEENIAG